MDPTNESQEDQILYAETEESLIRYGPPTPAEYNFFKSCPENSINDDSQTQLPLPPGFYSPPPVRAPPRVVVGQPQEQSPPINNAPAESLNRRSPLSIVPGPPNNAEFISPPPVRAPQRVVVGQPQQSPPTNNAFAESLSRHSPLSIVPDPPNNTEPMPPKSCDKCKSHDFVKQCFAPDCVKVRCARCVTALFRKNKTDDLKDEDGALVHVCTKVTRAAPDDA